MRRWRLDIGSSRLAPRARSGSRRDRAMHDIEMHQLSMGAGALKHSRAQRPPRPFPTMFWWGSPVGACLLLIGDLQLHRDHRTHRNLIPIPMIPMSSGKSHPPSISKYKRVTRLAG
jgi:hypothetical protein